MYASVNLKKLKALNSGGKKIYTRTMYLTMPGNERYSQKIKRKSDRKSCHMVLQIKTNSSGDNANLTPK